MRHEDIPPANEYGVVANRRKPCPPHMKSEVGGLALVRPFVRRLLNLSLPFTRLKIGSLDDTILINLQRMPGRVNFFPLTLNEERMEALENFFAGKGVESFTEYVDPWSVEPIIGYAFKGSQVADLVTELLTGVYGAGPDAEFNFALT